MLDITNYIKYFSNALNKSTAQLVVDHYYKNAPWRKSSFSTNAGLSPESSKKVLMNEYWIKKGDMYYDDLKKSSNFWKKPLDILKIVYYAENIKKIPKIQNHFFMLKKSLIL